MADIHMNIKKFRTEKGINQSDLAKMVGTTKQTISRYESGEIKSIPYDMIEKLSKALMVSNSDLMGWEEEKMNIVYEAENDVRFLQYYHKLSEYNKEALSKYAEYLLDTQNKK